MKIIFLDIDGVLNSQESLKKTKGIEDRMERYFDQAMVSSLNSITDKQV